MIHKMPAGYDALRKIRFENAEEVELLVCLDLMRNLIQFSLELERRMSVYHALQNACREKEVFQQEYLDVIALNKKIREWK